MNAGINRLDPGTVSGAQSGRETDIGGAVLALFPSREAGVVSNGGARIWSNVGRVAGFSPDLDLEVLPMGASFPVVS